LIEIVVSAALGVLGWAAVRVVSKVDALDAKVDVLSTQHAGFEITLKNGLTTQVQKLDDLISGHIAGEEQRILEALRNPDTRSRRGDAKREVREAVAEERKALRDRIAREQWTHATVVAWLDTALAAREKASE
jgi:hypothetical protein